MAQLGLHVCLKRATDSSGELHAIADPSSLWRSVPQPTRTGDVRYHLDRTLFNEDEVFRLAGRGCGLEWDFFGIESSYYPFAPIDLPNDGRRLELIRAVMARGHGAQVLIAHDICTRTRLRRFGGHGYTHLLENVVPVMRRKGFTEAESDLLLIDNPRRFLALS
jgi:phosphotriesterase-related protein